MCVVLSDCGIKNKFGISDMRPVSLKWQIVVPVPFTLGFDTVKKKLNGNNASPLNAVTPSFLFRAFFLCERFHFSQKTHQIRNKSNPKNAKGPREKFMLWASRLCLLPRIPES